jgi:hypothetical protein
MCKVSGNGRFAGATLLIQNRDDLHKNLLFIYSQIQNAHLSNYVLIQSQIRFFDRNNGFCAQPGENFSIQI